MGFSLFSQNGNITYGIKNYIADTAEDLKNIPKAPGSMAFVIDESKYYILNNKSQWAEKETGGGESINPSGTINIIENGNYPITNYANANVNVPQGIFPEGTIEINENGTNINIAQYQYADVLVPQPSGKITITQNVTDLNISQYETADINVSNAPTEGIVFSDWNSDGYPLTATVVGFTQVPQRYMQGIGSGNSFVKEVRNIIFADGIKIIGAYALYDSPNIQSIYLADSINTIYGQAFRNCGYSQISIGASNLTWDCYYNGNAGSSNGATFTFRNHINSIEVTNPIYHYGFGSQNAVLYDFSHNTSVATISSPNIGHKDGCIIRVPQSLLADWQLETNWCDLPTDSNESGYVVWEGV